MARPALIEKTAADLRVRPHWSDYDGSRQAFRWSQAREAMQGLPEGDTSTLETGA